MLTKISMRGKWIAFWLFFWTRAARFTRFGIHGFVLWRIRRNYEKAIAFNRMAQAHNKRRRKEYAIMRRNRRGAR